MSHWNMYNPAAAAAMAAADLAHYARKKRAEMKAHLIAAGYSPVAAEMQLMEIDRGVPVETVARLWNWPARLHR
jgi:hypothetical protein